MATKREIVDQALTEIGLARYIFDATPEELQSFLKRLDRMAAKWDGIGIRVGYNLGGDLNSESGLPDTAIDCFATNLGVLMAPTFGKTLSPVTIINAKQSYNDLMTSMRTRVQVPYPSRLPIGTGNKQDVLQTQYFGPDSGAVPGLDAGPLEYN